MTEHDRRWQHSTMMQISKGRYKMVCRCGWQTPWGEEEDVVALARAHTGLKEKQPKGGQQ